MRHELSTPKRLDIYFTNLCNLACPFCYYKRFQKVGKPDLSILEWESFIDELGSLNVIHIGVYGGEPLIRPDFERFITRIVKNRMRFNLISNGTLLTSAKAEFLAETNRCDYVQISVDGMEKEHDFIRGQGNWRKAINALQLLKQFGIKTHVNTVITRHNFHSMTKLVEYLIEEIGINQQRINVVSEQNEFQIVPELDRLSNEEFAELTRQFLPLAKKYPKLSPNSAPMKLYREITKPVSPTEESPFRVCSGLWADLAVRADGAILPCNPSEKVILGWANKDKINDIWHNSPVLNQLRQEVIAGNEPPYGEKCVDCRYLWYCRQACHVSYQSKLYCRKDIAALLGIK